MFKFRAYRFFLLFFLMTGNFLYAGPFEEAVKAYNGKDWKTAGQLFEQHLVNHKQDAHARLNLGNCFFQQHRFVDAIWNYEKAFKLDPSLDDLGLLLDKAYREAGIMGNWTPPVSYFQLKLFRFNSGTWALVLLALSLLSGLLLFVYFSSGRKKLLLGLVIFSLLIWVFCCNILFQREHFSGHVTHAIVGNNTNVVYLSEKGNAVEDMKLKAGERLRVIAVKERVEVAFDSGREFWLPKNALRLIE